MEFSPLSGSHTQPALLVTSKVSRTGVDPIEPTTSAAQSYSCPSLINANTTLYVEKSAMNYLPWPLGQSLQDLPEGVVVHADEGEAVSSCMGFSANSWKSV